MKSVVDLIDTFQCESKAAVIHNGNPVGYDRFYTDIAGVAGRLHDEGVPKNKSVIVQCHNKYHHLAGIYGAIYSGRIAVPISHETIGQALMEIAQKTESSYIVTDDDPREDNIFKTIPWETGSGGGKPIKSFPDVKEDSPAMILFTSGTTGNEKGTILTHGNLIWTSRLINKFMDVKKSLVEYLMIPVYHSFGFGRTRCVFMTGGTLVLDDGFFNPLLMMQRHLSHGCNAMSGVPSAIALLCRAAGKRMGEFGGKIEHVEIGSAPMPVELKEFLIDKLPNANISMHYGLTEASRSCFINFRKERVKLSSIGRPSPGVTVKIVDEKRTVLPPGQKGEIAVKGPNVAKGYFNEPVLNKEKFVDGWFFTGDTGYQDQDGYFYFVGRNDEIINVGGEKVSPAEIESILSGLNLPLGDYCIIGAEDSEGIYGSIPILCTTNNRFADDDFMNMNAGLTAFGLKRIFLPRKFHIVKEIPRTHTGKIMRTRLRDEIPDILKKKA